MSTVMASSMTMTSRNARPWTRRSARCRASERATSLPRDPHGGVRAPDRKAQEQVDDVDRDDRRPNGAPDCDPDACGPPLGVVAVIAVDQHHDDGEDDDLQERIEDIS